MKSIDHLKFFSYFAVFFISALVSSAQTDTISASVEKSDLFSEISSQTDSNTVLISKGRALIVSNILSDEIEKSVAVFDSLRSEFNVAKYVILYPEEEQMFFFIAKNKQRFFNSLNNETFNDTLKEPRSDNLYEFFFNQLKENLNDHVDWIDSTEMTSEERSVAHFYIGELGLYNDKPALRNDSRRFLKSYPQSEYKTFVKPLPAKFSDVSFGLSLGFGGMDLRGSVTDLASVSGLFSLEMNCFYNKLYTSFFLSASLNGLLKNDMQDIYNEADTLDYEMGNRVTYLSCGFRFGYLLYNNSWLKIYPYASFLGSETFAPYNDDDEISLILSSGAGLGAGVGIDVRLMKWGDPASFDSSISCLGLRLNGGADKIFAGKSYSDAGSLYFSAGIVWWFGG
jgi:hypothetical protein